MESNERGKIILLIGCVILTIFYCYFSFLVFPLQKEAETLQRALATLESRSKAEEVELKKLQAREAREMANTPLQETARHLRDSIPPSHVVTVPPAIEEIMEKHSLANAGVSLKIMLPYAPIPEYLIDGWEIRIPSAHPLRVGEALRDLENRFSLAQVSSLRIDTQADNGTTNTDITLQLLISR